MVALLPTRCQLLLTEAHGEGSPTRARGSVGPAPQRSVIALQHWAAGADAASLGAPGPEQDAAARLARALSGAGWCAITEVGGGTVGNVRQEYLRASESGRRELERGQSV